MSNVNVQYQVAGSCLGYSDAGEWWFVSVYTDFCRPRGYDLMMRAGGRGYLYTYPHRLHQGKRRLGKHRQHLSLSSPIGCSQICIYTLPFFASISNHEHASPLFIQPFPSRLRGPYESSTTAYFLCLYTPPSKSSVQDGICLLHQQYSFYVLRRSNLLRYLLVLLLLLLLFLLLLLLFLLPYKEIYEYADASLSSTNTHLLYLCRSLLSLFPSPILRSTRG
jgi:hypothetical protein